MEEETLVVRRVDKKISRKFRQKAVERRLRLGKALAAAMYIWIEKEEIKNKVDVKNLKKISGVIKTNNPVKWSEEADEILYGWKK